MEKSNDTNKGSSSQAGVTNTETAMVVEPVNVNSLVNTTNAGDEMVAPSGEKKGNSSGSMGNQRKRVGKKERERAKRKLELSLSGEEIPDGGKPEPSKKANKGKSPQTVAPPGTSGTGPSDDGVNRQTKSLKTAEPKVVKSKKVKPKKAKPNQGNPQQVEPGRVKPKQVKPNSQFWRAIVAKGDWNYSFSQEEQLTIESGLNQAILAAVSSGVVLRSSGVDKSGGRFVVRCVDQLTADWVVGNPSERLEAIEYSRLPKLHRCTVFIPDMIGVVNTTESTLTVLRGQNPGVKPERWRVLTELKKERGRLFIFGVDNESLDHLKSVSFKLHYGAGIVSVNTNKSQIKSGGGENEDKESIDDDE